MEKINDLTFSGHLGKSSSGEQHKVQELVGAVELHFSYHSTVADSSVCEMLLSWSPSRGSSRLGRCRHRIETGLFSTHLPILSYMLQLLGATAASMWSELWFSS